MDTLKKIIAGGPEKLLVISDFDRTLTKAFVDQKPTALISVMVREKIFDREYEQIAHQAYEYYRPIEIDVTLPLSYRSKKMQEWWECIATLLVRKQLSKAKLTQAMSKTRHYLRDGVTNFLTTLHQHNIPLIIFSGNSLGIESIEIFLQTHHLDFPNIYLIGNKFIWNKQNIATDYVKPLIHVLNKDFTLIKNADFYTHLNNRPNIIAIGDAISDLDMVKNCPSEHIYTVGFLNENREQLETLYQASFDTVIKNDGSFDYLNQLIAQITNT